MDTCCNRHIMLSLVTCATCGPIAGDEREAEEGKGGKTGKRKMGGRKDGRTEETPIPTHRPGKRSTSALACIICSLSLSPPNPQREPCIAPIRYSSAASSAQPGRAPRRCHPPSSPQHSQRRKHLLHPSQPPPPPMRAKMATRCAEFPPFGARG